MKITKLFFLAAIITLILSAEVFGGNTIKVGNNAELKKAIDTAVPGDEIILTAGVWKDIEINFSSRGVKGNPITLRAEKEGSVSIEGKSFLKLSGEYLIVSGLHFKNGYTPSNSVIIFRSKENVANHCRITNCVIDEFNQLKRDRADHWVEFWGRYNQLDHCYIAGKTNSGPTIMVMLEGNENIKNFHRITNNYFGPRPRKGGPHGETIQIGESNTSMSPCNTIVANNLFEYCDGEVEVISNKSNFNEFRNNVFYKSEGSLVLRHGNYCLVDGNYFIGDDNSEYMGGIRIVNTGHWITNNYFYKLKGQNFRSPLSVMNGIPKSPLNRYNQVTDVVVAYNTWVDCKSPWQFSVGSNIAQKDVLPLSEIRSARPIRTIVANNIIYNTRGDGEPIVAYDLIDGVKFKNNIINNQHVAFQHYDGVEVNSIEMKKLSDYLFVPLNDLSEIGVYNGFDFETISNDIFGNSRLLKNSVGAINGIPSNDPMILDKKKYGTNWFTNEKPETAAKTLTATAQEGDLLTEINLANNGDLIELEPGIYELNTSIIINKKITIQSKDFNNKAQIIYSGASMTPAFQMHPHGDLFLKNISLMGNKEQCAFASLKEDMSSHYNLRVEGIDISSFKYVLKAYKESFADVILFSNTVFKNCLNGLDLSEETNDEGDYNVEFLTIDKCVFDNIESNVIDYYRGGYDESTIGGNLNVTQSLFTNCGLKEENGILLNTRGIINVGISKNTFKNNLVKFVAVLWGAKNNTHSENIISNSGELIVEENLRQKMMY